MTAFYLLDTNIISCLSKKNASPKVKHWLNSHKNQFYLSVITLAELYHGAELKRHRGIDQNNEEFKRVGGSLFQQIQTIEKQYQNSIIGINPDIAKKWAEIIYFRVNEAKPNKGIVFDNFLAATALVYNLHLVTLNEKDFRMYKGLQLVNPEKEN